MGLALTIDPAREDVYEKLVTLSERLELWIELVELLQKVALDAIDPEISGQLLVKVGLIQQQHLGDESRAQEAFESALTRDESNTDAFEHLIQLFTEQEHYAARAELLLTRALVETDTSLVTSYQLSARDIEEHINDLQRAISVYQQVLANDEHNSEGRRT